MDNEGLICENCNRRVPSENYEMHLVHCKRNLKLCSLCGEAIQRSKEREHFEENHAEINCVQCGQKTTRSEEGNHLAYECGKRPITCHYWELRLPRERMTELQEFYATRTELCQKCSRYILVRDFMDHDSACDGGMNDRQHDFPVSLPDLWIAVSARWTWWSWTCMPASGGNRRFSNPSRCGRYRWYISWNGTNAWQFHKLGLAWQMKTTAFIVALPRETTPSLLRIVQWKEPHMISWQTFSATWKIDDGHLKWWEICGRELDWQNWLCKSWNM